MIKFKVDGVEVFNPLKGKLNSLIEYFVKFYGEEYRERITNRLTNTAYIFTGEVGAINSHSTCDDLEEYYDKKIERLTESFFKNLDAKNLKNVKYYDFNASTFFQLASILKDLRYNKFNLKEFSEDKVINFLVLCEAFNIIDSEQEDINESVKKICNFVKDKSNYVKLANLIIKANRLWIVRYKKAFQNIEEVKNSKLTILRNIEEKSKKISEFYANQINELFIDVFANLKNIDKKDLLENDEVYDYIDIFIDILEKDEKFVTKFDKNERVKLFKYLGVDHGENYEDYISDDFLLKIFKSSEIVGKYIEIMNNQLNEQAQYCPYFEDAIKRLLKSKINPQDTNITYDLFDFIMETDNNWGWTVPVIIVGDNQIYNICVCKNYLNLDTATLIHEQNHIIETDIIVEDDKIVGFKCGFEINKIKNNRRSSMIFNEVVNDYFALKIYNLCKQDNFEVGSLELQSSAYSKLFVLMNDFIEENMKLIIDCRLSSNPYLFIETIGKNNYTNISRALNRCYKLSKEEIDEAEKEIKEKTSHACNEELSENAQILLSAKNKIRIAKNNIRKRLNDKIINTSSVDKKTEYAK